MVFTFSIGMEDRTAFTYIEGDNKSDVVSPIVSSESVWFGKDNIPSHVELIPDGALLVHYAVKEGSPTHKLLKSNAKVLRRVLVDCFNRSVIY